MKRGKISVMVAEASKPRRGPGRPALPSEERLENRRVTLLSSEQCQRLRRLSRALGISEAAFIRQAVDRELQLAGIS